MTRFEKYAIFVKKGIFSPENYRLVRAPSNDEAFVSNSISCFDGILRILEEMVTQKTYWMGRGKITELGNQIYKREGRKRLIKGKEQETQSVLGVGLLLSK